MRSKKEKIKTEEKMDRQEHKRGRNTLLEVIPLVFQ